MFPTILLGGFPDHFGVFQVVNFLFHLSLHVVNHLHTIVKPSQMLLGSGLRARIGTPQHHNFNMMHCIRPVLRLMRLKRRDKKSNSSEEKGQAKPRIPAAPTAWQRQSEREQGQQEEEEHQQSTRRHIQDVRRSANLSQPPAFPSDSPPPIIMIESNNEEIPVNEDEDDDDDDGNYETGSRFRVGRNDDINYGYDSDTGSDDGDDDDDRGVVESPQYLHPLNAHRPGSITTTAATVSSVSTTSLPASLSLTVSSEEPDDEDEELEDLEHNEFEDGGALDTVISQASNAEGFGDDGYFGLLDDGRDPVEESHGDQCWEDKWRETSYLPYL